MNNPDLRKSKMGKQRTWSVSEISAGMEYYKELYGKYPSSHEIDKFEFLPTARSIQRSHLGLAEIRTKLGFEESLIDQTKGLIRSEKARIMYKNGADYESEFYIFLTSLIAEIRVHEHKILRPGHVCCDFFIYTSQTTGFAIDIFYAQDLFSVREQVRIKTLRYKNVTCETYYVLVGNESIEQAEIDTLINNRKTKLPEHIKILTEKDFKRLLEIKLRDTFSILK